MTYIKNMSEVENIINVFTELINESDLQRVNECFSLEEETNILALTLSLKHVEILINAFNEFRSGNYIDIQANKTSLKYREIRFEINERLELINFKNITK